jgi:hypothetical protein
MRDLTIRICLLACISANTISLSYSQPRLSHNQYYVVPNKWSYPDDWVGQFHWHQSTDSVFYSRVETPQFAIVSGNTGSAFGISGGGMIYVNDSSAIEYGSDFQLRISTTVAGSTEFDTAFVSVVHEDSCVFIDPSGTNGDGTRSTPYDGWDRATITRGFAYFQKRGTVESRHYKNLVNIASNGTQRIYLAAYGTGAKPKFDGASSFPSNSAIWLYNTDFVNVSDFEMVNCEGLGLNMAPVYIDINRCEFNNCSDNGSLYDFNGEREAVTVFVRDCESFNAVSHHYKVHEGFHFINCLASVTQRSHNGFTMSGNNIVEYCYSEHNSQNGLEFAGKSIARYSVIADNYFGVQFEATGAVVEYCKIKRQYTTAVRFYEDNPSSNCTIRYSEISHNSKSAIRIDLEAHHCTIFGNSIHDNGNKGIQALGNSHNITIAYNVLYGNDGGQYNIYLDDCDTAFVYNNTSVGGNIQSDAGNSYIVLKNNFFQSATGTIDTLTANIDLDTINTSEYFTDFSNHDYGLKPTASGAIDKGADVGLTKDKLGNPINGLPDIGAYEYIGAVNRPEVTIMATDANAAEEGSDQGVYTVERNSTEGDLIVYYSVSGTASEGDYTPTLPDSVVISDGNTTETITITPVNDSANEPDETIILTLDSDAAYSIGSPFSAIVTITDNDTVSYENMIAYWPFEEGSGTTTEDVTDNSHDGTLTNGAAFSGDSQIGSYSVTMDGYDDYISTGTINCGSQFTISTWVKIPAGASNIQTILSNCASGAGQNGFALQINTYGTTDHRIIFYTGNGSSYNSGQTTTSTFDYDQWNHVAVVVDKSAGEAIIYYNGTNVSSDSLVRTDFGTNQTIHIGQYTNNAWNLEGLVDDVLIFDYKLNSSEIEAIANGTPLQEVSITTTDANAAEENQDTGTFTISRGTETSGNLTVIYSVSGTASSDDYAENLTGSATISNGYTSTIITITPVDDSTDENDETVILTLSSGTGYTIRSPSSATVTIADNDTTTYEDMIAFWAFEEGSGTTAEDSTTNNNDGTLTNGAAFSTDEKYGEYSLALDGHNDYMDAGTLNLGNAFSVSMWAKIPRGVGSIQTLFANSSSGSTSDGIRVFVNTYGTTDRKIIVETGNGSSSNPASTSTNTFAYDQWNYVAIVVDKTNGVARIYYNGSDVTSDSLIRNDFATNQTVNFGQMTNNSWQMEGKIDQVRIYDRELTASESGYLKRALIPGKSEKTTLVVYPNPVTSKLYIKETKDIAQINILNCMGQILYSKRNNKSSLVEIDMSDYQTGYYILKLIKFDGQNVTKKLLKH